MRWGLVFCAALVACNDGTPAPALVLHPPPPAPPPPAPTRPGVVLIPTYVSTSVRINTDPGGASVREDGYEICNSTPCEVTFKGTDADPAKEHKLVLSKTGYAVETRTMKIDDSPITVKLKRAAPAWTPTPPSAPPPAPPLALPDAAPYRILQDPNLNDINPVPY